jgi:hypothetical protein
LGKGNVAGKGAGGNDDDYDHDQEQEGEWGGGSQEMPDTRGLTAVNGVSYYGGGVGITTISPFL